MAGKWVFFSDGISGDTHRCRVHRYMGALVAQISCASAPLHLARPRSGQAQEAETPGSGLVISLSQGQALRLAAALLHFAQHGDMPNESRLQFLASVLRAVTLLEAEHEGRALEVVDAEHYHDEVLLNLKPEGEA